MIFVSGKQPFVHHTTASGIGQATLDCLKAGVKVKFVFPVLNFPSDAQSSAQRFEARARVHFKDDPATLGRLTLLPLDLTAAPSLGQTGEVYWPGEYLSGRLRYTWISVVESRQVISRTLICSRDEYLGLCGFPAEDKDIIEFAGWKETLVDKPLPADGKSSVSVSLNPGIWKNELVG